jgi:acyl-CoA thioesterase-1
MCKFTNLLMRPVFRALIAIVAFSFASLTSSAWAAAVTIAVIGDSNIAGKGVSYSENFPSQLERALHARGYDVQVINAGINGDTAQGVLLRLDSAVPQGTQIAIVWVGINELRQGENPAAVEATRQAIAARLRARGIKVLLLGPRHGLANQPQYLTGDWQKHLNAAGYAVIVARTLPRVVALLGHRH